MVLQLVRSALDKIDSNRIDYDRIDFWENWFMFRYNNKMNNVVLIKIDFECMITKMDIVECICRLILNTNILFKLNNRVGC